MTIKVTISNGEGRGGKSVKVESINFDKATLATAKTFERQLDPGEQATFYVYQVKDLLISEVLP